MEEGGSGAAAAVGYFDAHRAEGEQPVDERARHPSLLIHLTDQRSDLAVGELEQAVAEEPLVVRERRKGGGHLGLLWVW